MSFMSVQGAKNGKIGDIGPFTPIRCRIKHSKEEYHKHIVVADDDMELEFLLSATVLYPEEEPGTPGYTCRVARNMYAIVTALREAHPEPQGGWYCLSPRLHLSKDKVQNYVPWVCLAYNGRRTSDIALSRNLKALYSHRPLGEILPKLERLNNASSK